VEMETAPDGVRFAYKDPNARVPFLVNWTDWLDGDTIATASVILSSAEVVLDSQSHTTTAHTIWLTGGVAGKTYMVTSRVVTAANVQDDRSFRLICRQR
jgi:hypothetical protein